MIFFVATYVLAAASASTATLSWLNATHVAFGPLAQAPLLGGVVRLVTLDVAGCGSPSTATPFASARFSVFPFDGTAMQSLPSHVGATGVTESLGGSVDVVFAACRVEGRVEDECVRPGLRYDAVLMVPARPHQTLAANISVPLPGFCATGLEALDVSSTSARLSWTPADSSTPVTHQIFVHTTGVVANADDAGGNLLPFTVVLVGQNDNATTTDSSFLLENLPPFTLLKVTLVTFDSHERTFGLSFIIVTTRAASIAFASVASLYEWTAGLPLPGTIILGSVLQPTLPDTVVAGEVELTDVAANTTTILAIDFLAAKTAPELIKRIGGLQHYHTYSARQRLVGFYTGTKTQWSPPFVFTSLPQPQPIMELSLSASVSMDVINITWAPQPINGPNATITITVVSLLLQPLVVVVCNVSAGPGWCDRVVLDANLVRSGGALFAVGVSANALGPSPPSLNLLLTAPVDQTLRSGGLTTSIKVGMGVAGGTALLLLVVGLIILRRQRKNIMRERYGVADSWELAPRQFSRGKLVGGGFFGDVYLGECREFPAALSGMPGAPSPGSPLRAAIKMCKSDSSDDRARFLSEANTMKEMSLPGHPNVVRLYGVHTQGARMCIVMEQVNSGNVSDYVQDVRRAVQKGGVCSLCWQDLIKMCGDTAAGMAYLVNVNPKFVHRDLAARNLLVQEIGDKIVVKICDFGLARSALYLTQDHGQPRAMMPVRWMAPEAILDGKFTQASDVWSFGVTAWEICTLGVLPYFGMSNQEVVQYVIGRHHLDVRSIPNIPTFMVAVIVACFSPFSADRPTFARLEELLGAVDLTNDSACDAITVSSRANTLTSVSGAGSATSFSAAKLVEANHMTTVPYCTPPRSGAFSNGLSPVQSAEQSHAPLRATDSMIELDRVTFAPQSTHTANTAGSAGVAPQGHPDHADMMHSPQSLLSNESII